MIEDNHEIIENRFPQLAEEADQEGNFEKAILLYEQAGHRTGRGYYFLLAGMIAAQSEQYRKAAECFTRAGEADLAEDMRRQVCKK